MWDPAAEAYVEGRAELIADDDTKAWLWNAGVLAYDPNGFFGASDNPDVVAVRVVPERAVVFVEGDGAPRRLRWRR